MCGPWHQSPVYGKKKRDVAWYAGVPRVFPEHQLPANLQRAKTQSSSAVQTGGSVLKGAARPSNEKLLATLEQCRVNVSIRHTAPHTGTPD